MAWALLISCIALVFSACPYPDFDLAPNLPVRILTQTPVATSVPVLRVCPSPDRLDLKASMDNPDDDVLFLYWYLNYKEGQLGGPTEDQFDDLSGWTLFPCSELNDLEFDGKTNTVELIVMDRRRAVDENGDPTRLVSDGGTQTSTIWAFTIEGSKAAASACCL